MVDKITCIFMSLLAALVIAGCEGPAEFTSPLSPNPELDPSAAVSIDEALLGTWYAGCTNDGPTILMVRRHSVDGVYDVLIAGGEGEEANWLSLRAWPTDIDGRRYFSAQRVTGIGFDWTLDGVEPGYFLATATLSDEQSQQLTIATLENKNPLLEQLKPIQIVGY